MVYLPTFKIYNKNQPNVGKYTIHGWYFCNVQSIFLKNTPRFFAQQENPQQLLELLPMSPRPITSLCHGLRFDRPVDSRLGCVILLRDLGGFFEEIPANMKTPHKIIKK